MLVVFFSRSSLWIVSSTFLFDSCLKCVRVLQQNGHLPSTTTLFKNYAQYGMFVDIRMGALDIIAGFLKGQGQSNSLHGSCAVKQEVLAFVSFLCFSKSQQFT